MIILDGKKTSNDIKEEIAIEVKSIVSSGGKVPHLSAILVGNDVDLIKKGFKEMLSMSRNPKKPKLWDGRTAERCLKAILNHH